MRDIPTLTAEMDALCDFTRKKCPKECAIVIIIAHELTDKGNMVISSNVKTPIARELMEEAIVRVKEIEKGQAQS
jgi:hypothetical protein